MILWLFFNIFMIIHLGECQLGSFYGCSYQECDGEKNFAKCELKGNYWTSIDYVNKKLCACCQTERAAQFETGSNTAHGIAQYYGNGFTLCQAIFIDEINCLQRKAVDCNYRTFYYKTHYAGCFYCRPRCNDDYECSDLARTCSLLDPKQPVKACVEQDLPESVLIIDETLDEDNIVNSTKSVLP